VGFFGLILLGFFGWGWERGRGAGLLFFLKVMTTLSEGLFTWKTAELWIYFQPERILTRSLDYAYDSKAQN